MEFINRRGFETILAIENLRLLVLGMYENGAAADNVRSPKRPKKRILQKSRPKALSLFGAIDGKSGEKENRHRMVGQSLGDARRNVFAPYGTSGERIIAHHAAVPQSNIGPRRAVLLVLPGVFVEVVIQGGRAAVKGR